MIRQEKYVDEDGRAAILDLENVTEAGVLVKRQPAGVLGLGQQLAIVLPEVIALLRVLRQIHPTPPAIANVLSFWQVYVVIVILQLSQS